MRDMSEHEHPSPEDLTTEPAAGTIPPDDRGMSRRQFLGAASVTIGGLVLGPTLLSACTSGGTTSTSGGGGGTWDQVADVVVVGTGAAAFGAACAAANKGASVIMLEKSDVQGGTSAKSGGTFWIPNNHLMQAQGLSDTKTDAMKYMVRLSYPTLYDPEAPKLGVPDDKYALIDTFYDRGSEAIKGLVDMGALQAQIQPPLSGAAEVGEIDYHADLPEDKAPRGRALNPAGEQGFGAGLVAQLAQFAQTKGVKVQLNSEVTDILMDADGAVEGVEVGGSARVRALKAVVFGSGGFTHNPSMRVDFLRGPVFGGCAVPSNTGDFIRMGEKIGASLGNLANAWWAEIPFETAAANPSVPNDIWIPYGDSMVMVNKHGRRVVNEKMVYNERTQAHFYWDPTGRDYPNLLLFMVYDDAVAQDTTAWPFRYPLPLPDQPQDLVVSGQTFEELATNLSQRLSQYSSLTGGLSLSADFAANLSASVQEFNGFAEQGVDQLFHRGETPIQTEWNGPARQGNTKNPTMFPFRDTGPYHAILLSGGSLDTKGGPKIDVGAHVLNAEGTPISRLYGAGNCIASPAGQAYWSAGGTLGPALTYGYIGGLNAAAEAARGA